MRTLTTYVLLGGLLLALGLPVLATMTLPHTFSPNMPIRSSEVNANFAALAEAVGRLETGKLNYNSGSYTTLMLLND